MEISNPTESIDEVQLRPYKGMLYTQAYIVDPERPPSDKQPDDCSFVGVVSSWLRSQPNVKAFVCAYELSDGGDKLPPRWHVQVVFVHTYAQRKDASNVVQRLAKKYKGMSGVNKDFATVVKAMEKPLLISIQYVMKDQGDRWDCDGFDRDWVHSMAGKFIKMKPCDKKTRATTFTEQCILDAEEKMCYKTLTGDLKLAKEPLDYDYIKDIAYDMCHKHLKQATFQFYDKTVCAIACYMESTYVKKKDERKLRMKLIDNFTNNYF